MKRYPHNDNQRRVKRKNRRETGSITITTYVADGSSFNCQFEFKSVGNWVRNFLNYFTIEHHLFAESSMNPFTRNDSYGSCLGDQFKSTQMVTL